MVWIFRLLIGAILALMVGCMLGALLLIIQEMRATRARRARIERAIDRIASPHILPIEDLDVKGEHDNVDNKKQD